MRTREAVYKDYNMSYDETKILLKACKRNDEDIISALKMAVHESNENIADELFQHLHGDIKYKDLETEKQLQGNLFVTKHDFYGYRRRALFLFFENLKRNDAEVIEQWKKNDYIRRYLSKKDAEKETGIKENTLMNLAKKADAVLKIGNMCLINMVALYDYLDCEYRKV